MKRRNIRGDDLDHDYLKGKPNVATGIVLIIIATAVAMGFWAGIF